MRIEKLNTKQKLLTAEQARGPYGLRIERDIHFQPQMLAAASKRGGQNETIPAPLDDDEAAAVAAFGFDEFRVRKI